MKRPSRWSSIILKLNYNLINTYNLSNDVLLNRSEYTSKTS
jgi:hypothetical protein